MTIPNQNGAPFAGARRAESYSEEAQTPPASIAPVPPAPDAELAPPVLPEETVRRAEVVELAPAAERAPVQVPEQAEDDVAALSRLSTSETTSTKPAGWRGLLSSVGIKVGPSAAEVAAQQAADELRADEAVIRQTTFTRAVGVLVANRKGSSGKTPISLAVGGTAASIRGGRTVIIEVADDPGTLTFRAEGDPARGVGQLVRDLDSIESAGQLAGYTAPQTSFAAVIGTARGGRPPLTGDDVRGMASVADRYYEVRVMDSGNQSSSSAFLGAIEVADVLVIPLLNAGDSAIEAVETLQAIRASGPHGARLADNAIVLRLKDGRPEHPQVLRHVDGLIKRHGPREVFDIPYDAHIAERGQLTFGQLAPATRAALTRATAGVFRALRSTVN